MCFSNFKKIQPFFMIGLLSIFLTANCKESVLEEEAINYLNKKYEKGVSKEKIDNEFEVIVDFSTEKKVEESDLMYLKNINNITVFRMSKSLLSDKGIEYLNPLQNLQVLSLENTNLTDKGLQMICINHPNLERLILNNTPITSVGLMYIGKLKKLNVLELRNTKIDDVATNYLSEVQSLRNLTLYNTKITDKSIYNLMKFNNIDSFSIVNTLISKEGAQVLKDHYEKSKTGTVVYWDPKTAP